MASDPVKLAEDELDHINALIVRAMLGCIEPTIEYLRQGRTAADVQHTNNLREAWKALKQAQALLLKHHSKRREP